MKPLTQRTRVLYSLAVSLAGGAAMVVSYEAFGLGGRWLAVPGAVTMFVVAVVLNLWLTGRPHFFTSPFKR